jgi:hypothetical protein
VGNEQSRMLGAGFFGVGVVLGLLLGALLAARLGSEAFDSVRSVTDRVLQRRERVRFEALLQ